MLTSPSSPTSRRAAAASRLPARRWATTPTPLPLPWRLGRARWRARRLRSDRTGSGAASERRSAAVGFDLRLLRLLIPADALADAAAQPPGAGLGRCLDRRPQSLQSRRDLSLRAGVEAEVAKPRVAVG